MATTGQAMQGQPPLEPPAPRIKRRWNKSELELLRKLYKTHSNAEIASVLGRKVASVVSKGHTLGLYKGVRRLQRMGRENISLRWRPTSHSRRSSASH
ncbi:MAG: hypothetical protein AB1898_09715 [Acidobacteriota bacterium]